MFSVLVIIRELVQLTSNEENAIQLYDFYDLRTFKRNIIKAEIITMYNSIKVRELINRIYHSWCVLLIISDRKGNVVMATAVGNWVNIVYLRLEWNNY